MGGEMKPSLDIVITAPFVVSREVAAGAPVREEPRISVARSDGTAAERVAHLRPRGGRVSRRGPLRPDEPVVQDETVVGGTAERPGRIVRVRGHSRP
jgi:hypothetical protein